MLHLGLATPQPTTAPLNAFPLRSPRGALTKDFTRKKLINQHLCFSRSVFCKQVCNATTKKQKVSKIRHLLARFIFCSG